MNGVFIDSNIILNHLRNDKKSTNILKKIQNREIKGYINQIVLSEVLYTYMKYVTKEESYVLKKNPEKIKNIEIRDVIDLFNVFKFLNFNENILSLVGKVISAYGLLPNDALIAATCKHYGIKNIATFDKDFKRVEFLNVWKP
ncbi:MAG: PIN domain-containing protein [Methanomicrobia archaeon]|nr:PIN domain-containing protein [Methanomicrobia archaeon]MCK4637388.1 PIN domain-containing protein [Methanomicrobia archaeon]